MTKKLKETFPGIGMRIIKSAIAVLICYLINMIRNGNGIVFYSQLAALWCIQMYRSNTKSNAIQRTIGTCVGAVYGLIYLVIYPYGNRLISNPNVYEMLVVSFFIILVLYTTVVLKKKQSAYFSCVVFLSIVVNHIGDLKPYLFVWNRMLDTMIGIAVGIGVNDIRLCLHPDRETLFISGLDDTLLNKDELLSTFSKVELNRMIDSGLKFTISTKRTPASLLEPMREIRLNLPVIVMDGAALYDIKKKTFLKTYVISASTAEIIMKMILEANLCWYVNTIVDDTLLIYYSEKEDKINKALVEKLRISPLRNYIRRPFPENESVIYFMLLDKTEAIEQFYRELSSDCDLEDLKIVTYPSNDYPGYSYIKIYNHNAKKENMIMYLKELTGLSRVVTMGTIPDYYDVLIQEDSADEVVKYVRKSYEPIFRHNKALLKS